MRWKLLVVVFVLLVAGCTTSEPGAPEGEDEGEEDVGALGDVALERVATGFHQPLHVTNAEDGSDRLFVVEQPGTVWIIQDGETLEEPFLDIRERVNDAGFEQGLLGLAFPPDYEASGVFYVTYTATMGTSILARYEVAEDDANEGLEETEEILLEIMQPFQNHNGGHVAFGPEGYLYYGMGDGGAAGDPQQNAQNTGTLLGTMMRIDVSPSTGYEVPDDNPFVGDPQGEDEIWAYGLRNPWRWSFDAATGDLYIGDVGQDEWGEVNHQPADSEGGENYGWNVYEGEEKYFLGPPESTAPDAVFPVAAYSIQGGDCSIIGGHVYRGQAVPQLEGLYVLGDYCSGMLRLLEETGDGWELEEWRETELSITSFGVDEAQELYVVDQQGGVFRFVDGSAS